MDSAVHVWIWNSAKERDKDERYSRGWMGGWVDGWRDGEMERWRDGSRRKQPQFIDRRDPYSTLARAEPSSGPNCVPKSNRIQNIRRANVNLHLTVTYGLLQFIHHCLSPSLATTTNRGSQSFIELKIYVDGKLKRYK
jgi:hypothetical protein